MSCEECWYFGRLRTGDRLCNKTGELLDYVKLKKGCEDRTEKPPPQQEFDRLQPLADRLGVAVEELKKYIHKEKEKQE